MYTLDYLVTTSTCDSEGRLKLYSALQMMQDCSEMWIDSEPAARKFFNDNNMTQLLATASRGHQGAQVQGEAHGNHINL